MSLTDFDQDWEALGAEMLTGLREWRLQHPQATLTEIEAALDERLARLRARLLQDTALASASADLSQTPPHARPRCPQCGRPLQARGRSRRRLQTQGGQEVVLERSYGVCPTCNTGSFPPR